MACFRHTTRLPATDAVCMTEMQHICIANGKMQSVRTHSAAPSRPQIATCTASVAPLPTAHIPPDLCLFPMPRTDVSQQIRTLICQIGSASDNHTVLNMGHTIRLPFLAILDDDRSDVFNFNFKPAWNARWSRKSCLTTSTSTNIEEQCVS